MVASVLATVDVAPPQTFEHLAGADLGHAVPLCDRVWWVGHMVDGDPFQCHVYLIEQGDQSVLIDLGAGPSLPMIRAKVEEVVPLRHVKWFVCHHQDPDVCGGLPDLEALDLHPEAQIVTHWRAESIIRHYGVSLPFWRIEKHGWSLELEDRKLTFILTPYLHFPGAFVTFDHSSGVLFSSDLFGGFTGAPELLAGDEDEYFEAMRLFHEHYMPSREILQHGLSRLEGLPIRAIAPQHGSIIPEDLVEPLTRRLSELECGLYRMVEVETDVRKLTEMNRALREAHRTLVQTRDFPVLMRELAAAVRTILPVTSIEVFAEVGPEVLLFAPDDGYKGGNARAPQAVRTLWTVPRDDWNPSDCGCELLFSGGCTLLLPLYGDSSFPFGVAVLRLREPVVVGEIVQRILQELIVPISVATERHVMLHQLEEERAAFRRMAVYDSLTGLSNRYALEDSARTIFAMHARGQISALAVAMYDLDHFKSVNDTCGHGAGDLVLAVTGELMRSVSREGDVLCRFGGEELVTIHAHAPGDESAVALAERIRRKLEAYDFGAMLKGRRVTVSAGAVSLRPGESLNQVLARADKALYAAKAAGRNRVVYAD